MAGRAQVVNTAVGLLTVAVAATFWMQRRYTSEFGGTFPDAVMILLAVLGLVLAGLGLVGRRVGTPAEEVERLPLRGVARAVILLAAWVATLPLLGYVVGGVLFFFLTTLSMRKERPTWRGALLDTVVAIVVGV
jgi:hypothetical protein